METSDSERCLSVLHGHEGVCQKISLTPKIVRIDILGARAYSERDPTEVCTVGFALERQYGVHAIGSDRRLDFDTWAGTVSMSPPGLDVFSESEHGGHYLALRWLDSAESMGLPTSVARRLLGRRWQWTANVHAWRLALRLCALSRRANPEVLNDLELQDEAQQLLLELIDSGGPLAGAYIECPKPQRAYAPCMRHLADSFEDDRVSADLTTLGSIVGETPLQFLRGFKRACGMTPHAYLMRERLRRACQRLASTAEPLAEVAVACGYSHQSHMGAALRRATGLTPLGYRRLSQG